VVGIVDEVARPVQPELERYLCRALMLLRWITLAALLAIVVMQPAVGYRRLPMRALVALFAGYSLVVDLLSLRVARSRPLVATAVLTLPAAAGLYALGAEPGGVLFVLFFLAVDYAAASMSPRGTLLYVAAAVLCAAAIDPLLPRWGHTMADVRLLAARLVILALVGAGMVILTRRLGLEHEASRITRDEAERLEALDCLRADFVASVSHDLRTPLTAVRAGLGMLETGIGERLPPEERQLLSDARLNVERLRRLIDDLLAYNQLEAGAVRRCSRTGGKSLSSCAPVYLSECSACKPISPSHLMPRMLT